MLTLIFLFIISEMAIISYNDLPFLRKKHPDKTIVFCSGSFDLPHAGHILFFEDCKNLGDILVVAVGKDEDIQRVKGPDRPILNEHMRLKIIDSLKPVDYSFHNNLLRPGAHYLSSIEEIFECFKPDLWVINNDGGEIENRKKLANALGIRLVILERIAPPEYENISTTSIIKKIRGLK